MRANTPPAPFQAHLRNESDNRRQTERKRARSICRGAKEEKQSLKEPSTPTPMPPTQPTLEASAEPSSLELCLARRRSTIVKRGSRTRPLVACSRRVSRNPFASPLRTKKGRCPSTDPSMFQGIPHYPFRAENNLRPFSDK